MLVGPNPEACLENLTAEFRENTEKLFQLDLADCMKLEAFKEFVMPKLDYAFKSTLAHRKGAGSLCQENCQAVAGLAGAHLWHLLCSLVHGRARTAKC